MPWEYTIRKVKTGGMVVPNLDGLTVEYLNEMGQQEWELVNSVPMTKGGGQAEQVYFYFKRPLQAGVTTASVDDSSGVVSSREDAESIEAREDDNVADIQSDELDDPEEPGESEGFFKSFFKS